MCAVSRTGGIDIQIHTYIYTCIYSYVPIHMYAYIYIHLYIHVYIYTYVYINIHMYIYTYIHIYVHIYIYINIYTYTYTHAYAYIGPEMKEREKEVFDEMMNSAIFPAVSIHILRWEKKKSSTKWYSSSWFLRYFHACEWTPKIRATKCATGMTFTEGSWNREMSRFASATPDSPRVFSFGNHFLYGHVLFGSQNIKGLKCTGGYMCFCVYVCMCRRTFVTWRTFLTRAWHMVCIYMHTVGRAAFANAAVRSRPVCGTLHVQVVYLYRIGTTTFISHRCMLMSGMWHIVYFTCIGQGEPHSYFREMRVRGKSFAHNVYIHA